MKVDYREAFKIELQKNILRVRQEIDNADFVLKITNHAEKYGRDYTEVRERILTDDMYAEIFAKDPSKQNMYEKLAANYLDKIEYIENFKNLPNPAKVFVIDGEITDVRQNDVKSIDFTFNIGDFNFYCSHKYIKALNGGAQDNQYNDIRNFLRNCNKKSDGNNFFIAICDGPYFTRKIDSMNESFSSNNVITLTIEEIEDYLMKFVKKENLK